MFLLAAMKLHCFVKQMGRSPAQDSRCVMAAIDGAIQHMQQLMRTQCRLARARFGTACQTSVTAREVRWLALTAFQRVLRRKQVRLHTLTPSNRLKVAQAEV